MAQKPNAPSNKTTRAVKVFYFEYTGIDRKGVHVKGEVTAQSLPQARSLIQSQNINILKIKKKSTSLFNFESKLSSAEVTLFTRQMATMLVAGIPLVQSLAIISEGAPASPLGDLARKIRLEIEGGSAFSIALKKNPRYFDVLYCSLVESGEQSGTLDTMLERIAIYKEKTDSLMRKIKKAMYYPIAVVVVSIIVTTILLVKVVPTFKDLFKGFGADLPTFTLFVLGISDAIRDYGFYIFTAMGGFIFLVIKLHKKSQAFRNFTQRLSLKLPIIGSIIRQAIIARFARTLATTTAAGVPLTEALDSVSKACGNVVYSNAIDKVRAGITAGQQMRVVMKKTGVFPILVVQMIGIGEESGSLEGMLSKIALIYEEEVDSSVDGLTTLLEPLIMVILGVIVGGLVIAMYLPIFKLGSVV